MTDTKRLKDIIDSRGLKIKFVAKEIGLTEQGFYNKIKTENPNEFKSSEIRGLIDLLELTPDEAMAIFFN